MIRWQHAALAAATAGTLCLAAAPAAAITTASASLGPLSLQLIDLDPLDGVAPSISFFGAPTSIGSAAEVAARESFSFDSMTRYGATPWGAVDATAGTALATASASVFGPGTTPVGQSLAVSGSAASVGNPPSSRFLQFSAEAGGQPNFGSFLLSSGTLLVVSGLGEVQATVGPAQAVFDGQIFARVFLELSGIDLLGDTTQFSQDQLDLFEPISAASGGVQLAESRMLSATFVNLSDEQQTGAIRAAVILSGSVVATPVPEPAAAAMMLAGLAALGASVRRRRAA